MTRNWHPPHLPDDPYARRVQTQQAADEEAKAAARARFSVDRVNGILKAFRQLTREQENREHGNGVQGGG